MMGSVTIKDIQELKAKLEGINVGEGKVILAEFRDKHKLTDRETLDIINDRY